MTALLLPVVLAAVTVTPLSASKSAEIAPAWDKLTSPSKHDSEVKCSAQEANVQFLTEFGSASSPADLASRVATLRGQTDLYVASFSDRAALGLPGAALAVALTAGTADRRAFEKRCGCTLGSKERHAGVFLAQGGSELNLDSAAARERARHEFVHVLTTASGASALQGTSGTKLQHGLTQYLRWGNATADNTTYWRPKGECKAKSSEMAEESPAGEALAEDASPAAEACGLEGYADLGDGADGTGPTGEAAPAASPTAEPEEPGDAGE